MIFYIQYATFFFSTKEVVMKERWMHEHCICPTTCDCQHPEPDDPDDVALYSNHCPIHNWDPTPYPECPAKVALHNNTARAF
jgi:hypothetical protein